MSQLYINKHEHLCLFDKVSKLSVGFKDFTFVDGFVSVFHKRFSDSNLKPI